MIENERIRIYPAEKEQMERLHPTPKYHMIGRLVWQ